jgi:hypothetical protein
MKEKYRVFENSNIFLRDLQYAIKSYYEKKGKKLKYSQAEKLAIDFTTQLSKENQLKKISQNAWKVNFFQTKSV